MVKQGSSCVLVSGGIDSAVALADAAEDRQTVLPVYVRSGFVWEPAEIYWLERFLQTFPGEGVEPLVSLDVPVTDFYGDHWSLTGVAAPDDTTPDDAVYLPGRNILLLSKTGVFAVQAGCDAIVIGPLAANPFPDGTREFFDAMGIAIGRGMGLQGGLRIETPLAGATKPEVIRRGSGLRLDLTFSCIAPTNRFLHCGTCNKCAERRHGFLAAGVEDPTEYARAARLS